MTALARQTPDVAPEPEPQLAAPAGRRRRRRRTEGETRTITSAFERRRAGVRFSRAVLNGALLVFLLVVCLGPILWLAKSAITPTQDTLRQPLALWPHGVDWANLRTAWVDIDLKLYFWNTVVIAAGSWAVQMVVAVTGGYVLAVLRPRGGRIIYGLVLATMFVPAVVLLVPLYLTVLDLPFTHWNLVNTYWGAFLPAGASAFNVALVKRFFDNLPREIIDAARVDGCGDFRLFLYVVLPMSRPVLGVVSVFAVLAAWKDFVWPLVVLPDPAKQPLSVRLPRLAAVTELDVVLAALLISCALPIAFFLVFQRLFLRGGLEGAVKG
ncbi:carbohydrate ABC transporter permease [Nocardioides mangrovi]|uniref:Carbohydrate ABC transporter permease n=1 Tax=Nocardioides mangrovi TaxID=2874580 RepID=A0ABS7UGX2_9ACTN|nr:carbohydrate ABC transporter permease [Nocardioides mangrovi]MBZ5739926.1 carbohydrate ABC transporter permease [Nocardioides mangrovi]